MRRADREKIVVNSDSGSLGSTLLGILFIGLRLTNHIDWPWVWVLAPFWVPLAVVLTIGLIGLILIGISERF